MTDERYAFLRVFRTTPRMLRLSELEVALVWPRNKVSNMLTRCYRAGLLARAEHRYWLTEKGVVRIDWMTANVFTDRPPAMQHQVG